MDYKQESEKILREIISDETLSKEENDLRYRMLLCLSGQTLYDFAKDLETGVKNGYSIEEQKRLILSLIEKD
jgi:hypothetical protein